MFSGLDKITGRIISFDVAINETVRFGALEVTPRACYSRPPTEAPTTDGFIEVDELTLQGEIKRIFSGWMFAASPGLNAVEHSIYDVWLTDCKGAPQPRRRGARAAPPPPQRTPAQRSAAAAAGPDRVAAAAARHAAIAAAARAAAAVARSHDFRISVVMPGLTRASCGRAASHPVVLASKLVVDCRVKPGNDVAR